MKNTLVFPVGALGLALLIGAILGACTTSPALPPAGKGLTIQQTNIEAESFQVKEGTISYPLGFGSGLEYLGGQASRLDFVGITDRGPNVDGPSMAKGQGTTSAKYFPTPGFTPQLVFFSWDLLERQGRVTRTVPLRTSEGLASDLPIAPGATGSSLETALSMDNKDLGFSSRGLDPEAVRKDPVNQGILWISDEYGPFIQKVDARTGLILGTWAPGKGLPAILAKRQPNRGMEGLAITPSGKVYGIMQSILDLDGKVKESKAAIIRMVELDPATGATMMFAYPLDADAYKRTRDAKIGDLVALNETDFLVIEQGSDKKGAMRNLVYRISLKDASPIDPGRLGGREPEELGALTALAEVGFKPATKELVLDLRAKGWQAEKAEGLALIDARRIMVVSDNDFGITPLVETPGLDAEGKAVTDPTDYTLEADGKLSLNGTPTEARVRTGPNPEPSRSWIITLPFALW